MKIYQSLEWQDRFVDKLFECEDYIHQRENKSFLDIACCHPVLSNNTYYFENAYGWTGLGCDIVDYADWCGPFEWSRWRKSPFVQTDVTQESFVDILQKYITNKTVDYISLDVDDGVKNYSLVTLCRILQADISFKVMTLEHEFHSQGELVRLPSRILLESLGYKRLFSDVSFKDGKPFEDWWVNPIFFQDKIFSCAGNNLYYKDCVERLNRL